MLTVLLALTPTGFAPSAATLQRHATISRTSQVSCAMDIAQIATMINTNEQLLIAGVVALGAMGAVTFKTEPVTEAEKRAHSERSCYTQARRGCDGRSPRDDDSCGQHTKGGIDVPAWVL